MPPISMHEPPGKVRRDQPVRRRSARHQLGRGRGRAGPGDVVGLYGGAVDTAASNREFVLTRLIDALREELFRA